jgi:Mn2+/Fe2+ NRAMP family transporter
MAEPDSTEHPDGLRGLFATLGPGLVTGAADDDPAGITTYSQAGAAFQYGLLWTVFLQVPLMIAVQYTCARIGLVTGRDLGRVLRDHYPVWMLWIATLLLVVANTVTAFSQLMGWFIMIAAAATLYPSGHREIGTANEAAQALAPLGGGIGTVLFSLGIIGTGLIAVPTLVGATAYAVAALARTPAGMTESPKRSKVFSATVAVGIVVAAIFALSGMSPVAMLLASALVNGILAAPMLVVVLLVANNRDVMASRRNGWLLNGFIALAAIIMGGASLWLGVWWLAARL